MEPDIFLSELFDFCDDVEFSTPSNNLDDLNVVEIDENFSSVSASDISIIESDDDEYITDISDL